MRSVRQVAWGDLLLRYCSKIIYHLEFTGSAPNTTASWRQLNVQVSVDSSASFSSPLPPPLKWNFTKTSRIRPVRLHQGRNQ